MLYKKYHRNFVKQFKKGTKFGHSNECSRYKAYSYSMIVEIEPTIYDGGIYVISKCSYGWILVFPSGRLIKDIDVIQEIS